MAFSWQESVKPAGTQDIQCDIEYLDKSYIHVYLDGAETTAFTWTSSTNIRLNSPLSAETVVLLIRKTEREYLYIEFASGAPFIEGNVDTQNKQFLHLAQELVEGRSIEGFYGDINMHRYRITNLGDPVDARDAANKQYVDAGDARLDQRIDAERAAWMAAVANEAAIRKAADDALDVRTTNLEQTYFNANTNSFPWWTVLTTDTDTVTPGMPFTKAKVRVNGVTQTAGYSYTVTAGVVKFAEVLPAGTLVDMTIGIDTEADTSATSNILGILAAADGYSRIGGVPSFEALRLVRPTAVGQRILLRSYYADGTTGGGEFIVKAGSAVDDAGHICVPASQSGIYLERLTSTVKFSDYGITTESNSSGPRVDQSDKVQAAINRAKSLKYVLDTEIASENHYIYNGVYVEKGIDITGLKTIRGCFSLLFDSTKIAGLTAPGYSDIQWALVNLNAKFNTAGIIFGTTVGNQSFDNIVVRDVSNRGASCGGQLHVTSGTMISGALCATDVNGPGVWVLGSYDSVISDIRTVNCGNALLWAIAIAGYRGTRYDNTNCMTIGRIESHDSLDRALHCSADLSDIGEIHVEATVVASNAVSSSATIADNGWGYANVLLQGLGTTYGSVRDLPVSGSIPAVFELVADDTSIGELSLPRSSLSIHYAFTTPRGTLSAGTINLSGDVIVTNGANTNIDALTVTGESSQITSSSANFNVGILRATGANATFNSIGGRYGRLECAVVFLTGSDVTRGSITNLTLGDRNTLTQVSVQTLLVNGTRNYLSDGFRVSGVSTLNGINNAASNAVFIGVVTLTDPWKFDKVYINSNLVYTGNTTSTLYDVSFQDVFVDGDLVLSGACRIHAHNLRVINLRIGTMSTGFIILNNCVVAGGIDGNYVGSFNVPAIGSITQNFTTGVPYVYTPTGWKLLTAAA